MSLKILSRLQGFVIVLDYWRLKPILVDIHLGTDDEHFRLVVTVAFGLSLCVAVGLFVMCRVLVAVTV